MSWDWAVDIEGGSGHVVESCEFDRLLGAVRLDDTVGAVVRGNQCRTRWWGVLLDDAEGSTVTGNTFDRSMRAVDVDGGTGAEVTGNVAAGGDSGCCCSTGPTMSSSPATTGSEPGSVCSRGEPGPSDTTRTRASTSASRMAHASTARDRVPGRGSVVRISRSTSS